MKHRFSAAAAVSFFVIPEQHRGNVHTEKLAFQHGKTGDHLIAIVVSGLVVWIALLAEYADGGGLLQHSVESVLGVGHERILDAVFFKRLNGERKNDVDFASQLEQ